MACLKLSAGGFPGPNQRKSCRDRERHWCEAGRAVRRYRTGQPEVLPEVPVMDWGSRRAVPVQVVENLANDDGVFDARDDLQSVSSASKAPVQDAERRARG